MEVRVVGAAGEPAPANAEGRLQARGAGNFVGYLKRPQYYAMGADGWFETGDIARMDASGFIRICGRSKDIIIRGGENIPVIEVEQLLYRHPAVRELAIVAKSDPRLGERACAFVVLRPGGSLSFDEMSAFLGEHRIARQYIPEYLCVVDELPHTATGKIQKFALRQRAESL
jgi:cyclohexanecarboxylate-CoA ligase